MTTPAEKADALVIFGATGDLAKLETFPALVGLVDRGVLDLPVIGVGKSGWNLDQFRGYASDSLTRNKIDPHSPAASKMLGLLRYVDGDLDSAATYDEIARQVGTGKKVLFYLEVPPALFGRITDGIAATGRALTEAMHQHFAEDDIYRVDHWLGLDPVENMLFVRFANSMIEPLLNRNHASKAQVVGALSQLTPETTVRGQYEGYHDVAGVDPKSTVETFAAVRLSHDSWRWAGVPILIRAGKCLAFAEEPAADMRPCDRLIGAALASDRGLFARQDTVEAAWEIVDPVLGDVVPVHTYPRGSWGPKEADALLPDGEIWDAPEA